MDNQEIRARALEPAIKMIKPEEINISRDDEQGDICLSRAALRYFRQCNTSD
jgi:hypothetical protein